MKILKDIPKDKYNDFRYCLNYLRTNKTIGDEEDVDYNGIFHVHWRGPIDNDKVILQIKSTLATQHVEKIYFWIENFITTITSPSYIKLNQFKKYVEVKVFDKNILTLAQGEQKHKDKIWQYYSMHHPDRRYKTDILRWVVTSIYGGVYTDADTLLLRDLRNIHINNWSSKWGVCECAEACILKLEKGSNIYEQMYLNNPNNVQCFLLIKNSIPDAYSYRYDNLDFTSLPTAFFDIVWGNEYPFNEEIDGLFFKGFENFFEKIDKDKNITIDNFFKRCFAYHWHNKWNMPELKDSMAGKLNIDIDKKIEEKYNIKPMKIFTQ